MTFQERITLAFKNEQARRAANGDQRLTKTELWKAAGATSAAATHWFNGSNGMDLDTCVRVAPLLSVNPYWLFDESRPMSFSEGSMDAPNTTAGPDLRGRVPLISWVQAGHWNEAVNNFQEGDADEWLTCPKSHSNSTFALRVRGVSMEPKYRDGAIIYVDPEKSADHLSNVVVQLDDEVEATFKQLVIEGGKRFLRPLNPDWPGPKLIEINGNATIRGVVIGQFIED